MALHADLVAELRKRFAGEIRLDLANRFLYSTDASIYQIEPQGVLIPREQGDLQAALETAAKYGIPIVPRGAGTSLAGQAIGDGLILDCSRWLDRVLEIDPERKIARVEPGVILATLNARADSFGLQFGPDPASAERATMGGVIANNATGAHSIMYGMSADHIASAEVVLSDGSMATFGPIRGARATGRDHPQSRISSIHAMAQEIRARYKSAIHDAFPRTWRNSAGYRLNYLLPWAPSRPPAWAEGSYPPLREDAEFNLAHLLAGSEGTLAVLREITVRLVPKPKHTVLGVLPFDGIEEACGAVPQLLEHGPSAIELVPRLILQAARGIAGYANQMGWLRGDPAAILVVEFSGDDPRPLLSRLKELGDAIQILVDDDQQAMVWATRKAGLGLLDSKPQSARPVSFIEDCAIPVENLESFVREIQRVMDEHGATGGIYGHASAGCLHIRPVLDLKEARGLLSLREIAERTMRLALQHGGAMSSEHGDGLSRGEWLRQTYGDEVADAMVALKRAADPDGILNPRKMLDAPPMDSHLRYGAEYRSRAWTSGIDFDSHGGLAAAIEQCNGQGVCRKAGGVMCPSYQATREEMHSTRGRANLLRALISNGVRGMATPSDPVQRRDLEEAVHQALDLCLGCKGCKAECPSAVDMPMLKSAYLEHRHRGRPRPIRDYVFGYFAQTAQCLNAAGPLIDAALGVPVIRRIAAGAIGITARRPIPRFKASKPRSTPRLGDATVLFLRDPFTHYVQPQVERAAVAMLEAAGFKVQMLGTMGNGAPLIAKGFLSAAMRHARTLVDEVEKVDPGGDLPLVLVEPSELSAVREDYARLSLRLGPEAIRRLSRAQSVEHLLVSSGWRPLLPPSGSEQPVIFHPHCHEKAAAPVLSSPSGTQYAGMDLLRACGCSVELVDAGCCGMGGMFGYEAEHYELSQKIGALKLFPAIKAHDDAWVAATGGSCRLHISQGTGRTAEHPLVFAARRLGLMEP
jgi:FAD/FMN-containing dehydrogenase/Fe-S oxidoreductase